MLRALSLACLAGGAGFRPSTDSDSRSSPEVLGEMGNVDFGCWASFRNLVGFNVSQSTSAQAGCSRVLGFGGKGVRCMLRALSLACLAGGAGFRPSTDSDSRLFIHYWQSVCFYRVHCSVH